MGGNFVFFVFFWSVCWDRLLERKLEVRVGENQDWVSVESISLLLLSLHFFLYFPPSLPPSLSPASACITWLFRHILLQHNQLHADTLLTYCTHILCHCVSLPLTLPVSLPFLLFLSVHLSLSIPSTLFFTSFSDSFSFLSSLSTSLSVRQWRGRARHFEKP